jgi:hypothetical protein
MPKKESSMNMVPMFLDPGIRDPREICKQTNQAIKQIYRHLGQLQAGTEPGDGIFTGLSAAEARHNAILCLDSVHGDGAYRSAADLLTFLRAASIRHRHSMLYNSTMDTQVVTVLADGTVDILNQIRFTIEGGVAFRYTSDAAITLGYGIQIIGVSANGRVQHTAANADMPIGVAHNACGGAGEDCWVVQFGKVNTYVLATGGNNPTRGNIIYSSGVIGQADHAAALPAVAAHNREWGHLVNSRVGAGLVLATLHWN